MQLQELQEFQKSHDENFHADVISFDRAKQIEHCTFHLAKLAGLFGTYCEKMHHDEEFDTGQLRTRIPDILVFALKFANLFDIDLESTYLERIREIEQRGIP